MDKHNTYNHKGVEYAVSEDMIDDAKNCYGIDLVYMTNQAIDLMLIPKNEETGISKITKIKISNSEITDKKCVFQIRYERN